MGKRLIRDNSKPVKAAVIDPEVYSSGQAVPVATALSDRAGKTGNRLLATLIDWEGCCRWLFVGYQDYQPSPSLYPLDRTALDERCLRVSRLTLHC
jgi:hypothetical protein